MLKHGKLPKPFEPLCDYEESESEEEEETETSTCSSSESQSKSSTINETPSSSASTPKTTPFKPLRKAKAPQPGM